MTFQVNDRVVHSAHGVGQIVGLVTRRFPELEARQYYEVAIERSTVWVPVDGDIARELRLLTPKAELARYRAVLQGRPTPLTPDHRQRRLDLNNRLKVGSLQELCEVVRDLTARGWKKPLNEMDAAGLRRAREGLCREWAAAAEVSVAIAAQEIDALLLECKRIYRV